MSSSSSTIHLQGGRIVDPVGGVDYQGDLLLVDGKIAAMGSHIQAPPGATVVPIENCWIIPSLLDLHTSLRDPGYEHKETLEELCDSATAGGYTALVVSPDTIPVVDQGPAAVQVKARAENLGMISMLPLGALFKGLHGEMLADMSDLVKAGIVGFSDGGRPIGNIGLLRRSLEYLSQFRLPLFLRCEHPDLAQDGVMHEGSTSTRLGLRGIPSEAEEIMVFQALSLAGLTGGRIHLGQISTAGSVQLIRAAKKRGVQVTCDVSPQHLFFDDSVVLGYRPEARISPPLRGPGDREALLHGINDGTIDAIASGHMPQSELEREVEFEAVQPGVSSLETTLPAVLTLVDQGKLTLSRALDAVCHQPRRIVGAPAVGFGPGASADLVVVAPGVCWRVDSRKFKGSCRSTPFEGMVLTGEVHSTYMNGRQMFKRGLSLEALQ